MLLVSRFILAILFNICKDNSLCVNHNIYPDDAGKLSDLMHLAELALHASKQAKYAQTPARPTAAPAGDLTF